MSRWSKPESPKKSLVLSEDYEATKNYLLELGGRRCVYCGILEARCGGVYYMHVEHYRPKSKFPKRSDDLHNLYVACAICNVFKRDDWPMDPDGFNLPAYPEPVRHDYNELFSISSDGRVSSAFPAGSYMTVRLALNRVQLILDRRFEAVSKKIMELKDEVEQLVSQNAANLSREQYAAIVSMLLNVVDWINAVTDASPYALSETRRPS